MRQRRQTASRRQRSLRRRQRQRQRQRGGGPATTVQEWGAAMLRQLKDARTRTPLDAIDFAATFKSDELNLDRTKDDPQFKVQLYTGVPAGMYDIAAVTHEALQEIGTIREFKELVNKLKDLPDAQPTLAFLEQAEQRLREVLYPGQAPAELADAPAAQNPVVLLVMIVNIAQGAQQQRPILGPSAPTE
jgi:hypothetical protein